MNYSLILTFRCAVIALAAALHVNARCLLQANQLRDERRIIIKYENQQLKLLRELSVKDGSTLYFVCTDNDITEVTCEHGQFNTQLPLPMCLSPLTSQLNTQEVDKNLCPYQLYRVGFQIRLRNHDNFFESYKACFDSRQLRAVFTINEAYPFVLSRADGMRFAADENIFTPRKFSAYNKPNIYAQFKNLLGSTQRFMPPDAGEERIDRGHLTPVGDYVTNSLMDATFKMINVIPQFHTINDGNWKTMEEWARNSVNTPSKVCSGALQSVLQLPDSHGQLIPIYLIDNLIPIPLWTYKIVLNRSNLRTVFLTYNNIHDKNELKEPQFPTQFCERTECPKNIHFKNDFKNGYTYCCNDGHFLNSVVPNLKGNC